MKAAHSLVVFSFILSLLRVQFVILSQFILIKVIVQSEISCSSHMKYLSLAYSFELLRQSGIRTSWPFYYFLSPSDRGRLSVALADARPSSRPQGAHLLSPPGESARKSTLI